MNTNIYIGTIIITHCKPDFIILLRNINVGNTVEVQMPSKWIMFVVSSNCTKIPCTFINNCRALAFKGHFTLLFRDAFKAAEFDQFLDKKRPFSTISDLSGWWWEGERLVSMTFRWERRQESLEMMRDKGNLLFILSILNTATSPASNSTNLPGASSDPAFVICCQTR